MLLETVFVKSKRRNIEGLVFQLRVSEVGRRSFRWEIQIQILKKVRVCKNAKIPSKSSRERRSSMISFCDTRESERFFILFLKQLERLSLFFDEISSHSESSDFALFSKFDYYTRKNAPRSIHDHFAEMLEFFDNFSFLFSFKKINRIKFNIHTFYQQV